MKKIVLLILICLVIPTIGFAVHLVGGVISYEQISASQYEVTLKVYRDCAGNGADFDGDGNNNFAILGVFNGNNSYYSATTFSAPDVTEIDPFLSGLCENLNIPACVQEGVYTKTINLPPNSSGYYLVYQRCCRNGTIDNIVSPDDTGNTFTAFVPPSSIVSENSSPEFNGFPPVALCLNSPLEFDHSASDLDGDSIVYSFCTPFTGGSAANPQPNPPSNPNYNPINWAFGYSEDYQIDSDPVFNIDSQTGFLTGTPTQQGQYVIGICAREFRDGVFLSEIRRDFQFNVLLCPSQPIAVFVDPSGSGGGTTNNCMATVEFENNSENGINFFWDFGDGSTSTEFEPIHTYDEGGSYEVTLVVSSNNNCSDTSITTITISGFPAPVLNDPFFECLDDQETYSISIQELDLVNFDTDWSLNGVPVFPNSNTSLDNITFDTPGEYTLSVTVTDEVNCSGSDEIIIDIPPSPIAEFFVGDSDCSGTQLLFTNLSTNQDNWIWDFGFANQDDYSNQNDPYVSFPASGSYEVSILASAASTCSDTFTETVIVAEPVLLELSMPEAQCQVGNSTDFIPQGNFEEPATYQWNIQDALDYDPNAPSQTNVTVSQDGYHAVELLVVDANDCEFTINDQFLTIAPLDVNFETEGSGCVPYAAAFDNNTTGGSSLEYQWSFGDGQTSSAPSPFHLYNQTGTFDISLTVSSTFGCLETATFTLPNALSTFPTPKVGFAIDPFEVDILEPNITITSEVDSVDCNFYLSDGSSYEDCFIEHSFNGAGLFEITQYTTNEHGCSASTASSIRVNGHVFYAPNAITMNDDGLNDFFRPSVIGEVVEYDLEIFDRWGQIVFKTTDPKEGWRPDYSHDGVYSFTVRVRDYLNIPFVYSGVFVSVR
ncbi:MAG: gliding motility-associated-like protein [Patiriisocius sp.]|jgi:gliding motility-associated-like protein